MTLNLFDSKGTPVAKQRFSWRELTPKPISKLDDDAFTRVRVILMNGVESDAVRLQYAMQRFNRELRLPIAEIMRAEHHQQTMINWLLSPDHSPLEITIGYEQVAIEVTSSVAQNEPDPYLAQVYRFGLLEDFDHLYRYAALMDRLEGKDANNILQGYTDIIPGRPTSIQHRHPEDDLRDPYGPDSDPLSKIHAALITAAEYQTHEYYMHYGPWFADPVARQLYAEIASVEAQHVTQYSSLINPDDDGLTQLLMHEAMEVYTYWSCMEQEDNPRIKAIWERFFDYELGHFHTVAELYKKTLRKDPQALFPKAFDRRIEFKSHRDFVAQVLQEEVHLRARGPRFIEDKDAEGERTIEYRETLNADGIPSDAASAGYQWYPGTELARKVVNL
ncbi:MAG: hypothetical protein DIU74_006625 [Pseudomonadota bacterium]|nr:MAG: hypothetical protein DIU74_04720 [Pseudomonadota bacterium]